MAIPSVPSFCPLCNDKAFLVPTAPRQPLRLDETGQRYGRLTVLHFFGMQGSNTHWCCICVCGKNLVVAGNSLRKGNTKSCGCLSKEVTAALGRLYGGVRARSVAERLWKNVVCVDSPTDTCWHWLGAVRNKKLKAPYGVITIGTNRFHRTYNVHKIAYQLCHDPVPAGLVLDHLCRNTLCVNPAHLEPVTNKVNVLRGVGSSAQNARKTHCAHGHLFDEKNTWYRTKKTGIVRYCRQCREDDKPFKNQRWRERNAARQLPSFPQEPHKEEEGL